MIFFRQIKPPIPAAVSQLRSSKYFYIAEGGFGRRAGPDTRERRKDNGASSQGHPHSRPQHDVSRSALHHDACRLRRGGHQGGTAQGRRPLAALSAEGERPRHAVPAGQPEQEEPLPEPQGARGQGDLLQARPRRRRRRRAVPPRRGGEARHRLRNGEPPQPQARLLLHLRLRPGRPVPPPLGARPQLHQLRRHPGSHGLEGLQAGPSPACR